jgi:hypothetical protein
MLNGGEPMSEAQRTRDHQTIRQWAERSDSQVEPRAALRCWGTGISGTEQVFSGLDASGLEGDGGAPACVSIGSAISLPIAIVEIQAGTIGWLHFTGLDDAVENKSEPVLNGEFSPTAICRSSAEGAPTELDTN